MLVDVMVSDFDPMMGVSVHADSIEDYDIRVCLYQVHGECMNCTDWVDGCELCQCIFDNTQSGYKVVSSVYERDKTPPYSYRETFKQKYNYFDDAFFQYVKLVNEAQEKVRAFEAGQAKKEAVCNDH